MGKHVDYKLIVLCQHRQGPEEEWITWRRFSDLHDFHLRLKVKLYSVIGQYDYVFTIQTNFA